jgi:hypothetical protein
MANSQTTDAIFCAALAYVKAHEFVTDATLNKKVINVICESIENSRSSIEKRYERINKHTKDNFMERDADIKLDRHKCAAAFMIAFLEKLDFDSDFQGKIEKSAAKYKILKEKIAIEVGKMIMVTMIKGDNRPKNRQLIDFLAKNGDIFKYPKVESDEKQYEVNWAIELYHARKMRKLFVPSLSNELFCLEKYNRMRAGAKE